MESFKYRKKEIVFYKVAGEVLGNDKYSETHVSSSGGGGYVGQYGGHVSAPQVSSITTTNQEIWIKTESGSEESIQLKGYDIPMRSGHKISVILAGNKDAGSYYTVIVNHSTGKHWLLHNADGLNERLNIERATGKSLLIAVLMFFSLLSLGLGIGGGEFDLEYNWILWGLPIGFLLYRNAVKASRYNDMCKALNLHLENIVKQAYQNT
jgi:hypothetical protein